MDTLSAQGSPVAFGEKGKELFEELLQKKYSARIILVDENTHRECLPSLLERIPDLAGSEILEIEAGEEHKNLDTCRGLWEALADLEADRSTLLINLGGGVVTDMGGFVAACYKRGIRFVNIPTTLLSQVDASVGGKTGVDLGLVKNLIGVFSLPEMVWVDSCFLSTLDARQKLSGFAEILKHGLIYDKKHWEDASRQADFSEEELARLVYDSVRIKNEVVNLDWKETGLRKILNFGHTIGHAIETYYLENKADAFLLHGEAVAAGMVCECYLSSKIRGLDAEFTENFKEYIKGIYGDIHLEEEYLDPILEYMKQDKKNRDGKINFSLLEAVGRCTYDNFVDPSLIKESLRFYR